MDFIEIDILGVKFSVIEVDVVDKYSPKKGEINYLTNEIKLDKEMPLTLRNQVLTHEILHAIFDLLGFEEFGADEKMVQCLATAIHQVFTANAIFS